MRPANTFSDIQLSNSRAVDVDERYLNEKGKFELNKAGLMVYSHGEYYALGKNWEHLDIV